MSGSCPLAETSAGLPVFSLEGDRPNGMPPELAMAGERGQRIRKITCPIAPHVVIVEVLDAELGREILLDEERFCVGAVPRAVTVTGAERAKKRGATLRAGEGKWHNAILPLFSVRRVAETAPVVTSIAHRLINRMPSGGVIDARGYTEAYMSELICRMLGLPRKDREKDWAIIAESSRNAFGFTADEQALARQDGAWQMIEPFFADALRTNRYLAGGAIDRIRTVFADKGYSDEELLSSLGVFANGAPAALVVMDRLLTELPLRPDLITRGLYHPEERDTITDQLMVAYGHFPLDVTRASKVPVEIDGEVFPAGTIFLNSITAIIQNGGVEGRRAANFIFGEGSHFCLGAALTRLWLKIGVWDLLETFPDIRLAVRQTELNWDKGMLSVPTTIPLALGKKVSRTQHRFTKAA